MQLGVTNAAMRHSKDDFGAGWFAVRYVDMLQWSAVLDYCPGFHACPLLFYLRARLVPAAAFFEKITSLPQLDDAP